MMGFASSGASLHVLAYTNASEDILIIHKHNMILITTPANASIIADQKISNLNLLKSGILTLADAIC